MRIVELYKDYHIPFASEGHKHSRPGWVQVECPFCSGNPGYHLGYNLNEHYFNCWRCGGKHHHKAISKILGVSAQKTDQIIKEYGGVTKRIAKTKKVEIRRKSHKFPAGFSELQKTHKRYLEKRNFDPEKIEKQWGLVATGPVSFLDGINYSHRIIAPINWKGEQVSFQARDITNKHILKYMACPKDRELIEHQTILYGIPEMWGSRIIIVEGITDAWRLNGKAVATFGIDYTTSQLRWISKLFKDVVVLFDPDPQATKQAIKLINELRFRGIEATKIDIPTDPGDMSQDDADHLVKQIMSKIY